MHGAHGYLIGQFLDPRFNDRTDRYGGSPTNRFRIVLEVLSAIRAATGPDFQVGIRLTPEGFGKVLTAADAQWCLDQGADFVGVGVGAILHHDFAARVIGQADFTPSALPVTREHLAAQHVGPVFIDYLANRWEDFVAAE